jgi:hypothetical protein
VWWLTRRRYTRTCATASSRISCRRSRRSMPMLSR